MSDTFDKIVGAIAPSLARKPKRRRTAAAKAPTSRDKHLATIKKNLAKLAKDIEKLGAMVAGGGKAKASAAKKRTAKKPVVRKSKKR